MKDHKLREYLGYDESNPANVWNPFVSFPNSMLKDREVIGNLGHICTNLIKKIDILEQALTEKCTYCHNVVPKGETYYTGETFVKNGSERGHHACDKCLSGFAKNCKVVKTGYANKAKSKKEKK